MKSKWLVLMVFLSACAPSLHEQVLNEVHPGDSQQKVKQKFGAPASFAPLKDHETLWVYLKHRDACGIKMKDQIVNEVSCMPKRAYIKAGGVIPAFVNGINYKNGF